jgi:amino acid transporter/nucleotide-binding universal stress UspA family protein
VAVLQCSPVEPPPKPAGHDLRQLGFILAWAVVFCDIGTSVYYVPGILYGEVGNLAPTFVALTTIGFLLLASKYVEVSWKNPEGGGVVTVATKAFSPFIGALGGMLIIVDYFLTAAISSVSAFQYLGSVVPWFAHHVELMAGLGLVLLGVINIVGIRESAMVALWMAVASLAVNLVVVATVSLSLTAEQWRFAWDQMRAVSTLPVRSALVGFAGAWLAFSGLESISQLSPAMKQPIRRTAVLAMILVVITMALTSPTLTLLAIAGLSDPVKHQAKEFFVSELGRQYGGIVLAWSVVVSAGALLLFAANTALIGGYHVFLALARGDYMPRVLARRNRLFGTPHVGIVLFTAVTFLIVHATRGELELLGHLYSFGLLGAFTFTSAGVDVLRWRAGERGPTFLIGLVTTAMVATAWGVNIVTKWQATLFGGVVVAIGCVIAVAVRKDWAIRALHLLPWVATEAVRRIERAEDILERRSREVVSLETAAEAAAIEPSRTLVALRDINPRLIEEAIRRARGAGDTALFVLGVTEWPGLFSGEQAQPEPELLAALEDAADRIRAAGITPIPIWRLSHDAPRSIADAAHRLHVDSVMVGVSQRSNLVHMLRGSVLKGLHRLLPGDKILIHTVG